MYRSYHYAIIALFIFSLLLVLSSILLFQEKMGISVDGILSYYLGSEEHFTQAKSFDGLVKLILPHTFAYGLFSLLLLHFLVFTSLRKKAFAKFLLYTMFVSAICELLSPFGILQGFSFFAYVKLVSFFLFNFVILLVAAILLYSSLYER